MGKKDKAIGEHLLRHALPRARKSWLQRL